MTTVHNSNSGMKKAPAGNRGHKESISDAIDKRTRLPAQ
jgi:hypothetical protein